MTINAKRSNPSQSVDTAIEAATSGSLYQKEAKIYPREVKGRYARLRALSMYVLLGLYYCVAWFTWEGRQAVLFDLPARKFHVFGLTFWPQDFIFLAILLLILALILFFFTALAGRLWCGYACPQTVWTEAFLMMERWAEGKRHKRIKLDAAPWGLNKLMRKSAKQVMWITFSLWTGITFVGYFSPIRELFGDALLLNMQGWTLFWVLFYALATYGNAGFLREQVCKYMCPYARFQSAMFDKDTLVIAYDANRGEPRGSRKRSAAPEKLGLGSCIDCTLCVQVCPTGIDIRQGLQIECIACAACIDTCDEVMDKMNYPRGLIRYTSENAVQGKPVHVIRPRMLVYATLLLVIIAGFVWSIANRTPLRMEVVRDRNALYREVADQKIENVYTLRIINMTEQEKDYGLTVSGIETVELDVPPLIVAAGQSAAFVIRVRTNSDAGVVALPISLELFDRSNTDISVLRKSNFFLPSLR